jgi:ATP-dependent Lhr-like helicase
MVMIGRESLPQGAVDDELLLEAETLAGAAMQVGAAVEPEGD